MDSKHEQVQRKKNRAKFSWKKETLGITLAILVSLLYSPCEGVGIHKEEHEFCYSDPECGPGSHHWGDICQHGLRQSPIPLPIRAPILPGVTALHLNSYRGAGFRMQNNGHTVQLEFIEPPDSFANGLGHGGHGHGADSVFAFPDPIALSRYGKDERIFYRFDSAHFHWGATDEVGSEHCFDDRCFSMELHLVHYLSNFNSMEDAMDSGDPNALAVVAVMLDVTPAAGDRNPVLASITSNLFQIEEPSHEEWTYVNIPLDFTPLLATRNQNFMYTYKGSLTTPDCNEQVNWYVLKRPIAISHQDVKAFRFLRDNRGEQLRENHRPLQNRNGRPVFLSAIRPI